jgi:protein phosphatase
MISKVDKLSEKGLVRTKNEDNIISFSFENENDKWNCFAVADGVGGHNAGDLASSLVVEKLKDLIISDFDPRNIKGLIVKTINNINQIIYNKSLENEKYNGMGTTITMALINKNLLHIGHVGDSRAYLLREKSLELLTQDHSIVGKLVKQGKITKAEAMTHPRKNIILQAVGLENNLRVDYIKKELHDNDSIILCTDGFSDLITEEEIQDVFNNNESDIIERLKEIIIERGAHDNYSIIIAKWVKGECEYAVD